MEIEDKDDETPKGNLGLERRFQRIEERKNGALRKGGMEMEMEMKRRRLRADSDSVCLWKVDSVESAFDCDLKVEFTWARSSRG
ncbi:hypothetical protein Csa_002333 [Cucumis sativus]|uniref:Uncharacterized protein n=1 Tax=Cucumis sativus TaxID=3659 RepID=A0A0A0LH48_CUCSA|nr:hypothetical protein Csa_002333 [Cucumis sativus]